MATRTQDNPNDSGAFEIDQIDKLRLQPRKRSERASKAPEKTKFPAVINGVIARLREHFKAVTNPDEATNKFQDPSISDYLDEESGERNADLDFVILEVQFLVETLLEHEHISQEVKQRSSNQIKQIEDTLESLSDRYQSNEREVRGAKPDIRYGYLEPKVQKVYDGIHEALEMIKDQYGIR